MLCAAECRKLPRQNFGELKIAGDWYSKAAEIAKPNRKLRASAASCYREAKLYIAVREQLKLLFEDDKLSEADIALAYKEMFLLLKETGDGVTAFCFGEAALQFLPNDADFRFSLAYAYGEATGGYWEHDYRDLSLFHYRILPPGTPVVRNNLGVCYNSFDAVIHAADQFIAASKTGYPLVTASVVRQYLRSGFTEDAQRWADQHQSPSDGQGDIVQALGGCIHPGLVSKKRYPAC